MFKTTLLEAVLQFIPLKTACIKENKPWINHDLRKLIRRRDHTFKKMRKDGTGELKAENKRVRREVQQQLRRAYWTYLNNTFTGEDSDQAPQYKRFWSFIKHQKSANSGVAPLMVEGRLVSVSDPTVQA